MIWRKDKPNMRQRWWAAGLFAAVIVVNGLAGSTTLIGGQNTAAVSEKNVNLFTPAGYTFAIWGVIYLLLALYVTYQLGWFGKLKHTKLKTKTIEAITPYFIATSALNVAWIFAWQYEVLWLSVLLIVAILYSLVRIEEVLKDKEYTPTERLLVRAPFSIYYGWITVATIANIATWLVSSGWNGGGLSATFWTVVLLIAGAFVAMYGMMHNKNYIYGAVFIWAYGGILTKHLSAEGWNGEYQLVIGALWALMAVLVAVFGVILMRTSAPTR